MDRYICIHAHFYQPPRENPWLEEVEIQDSAYPYHDWNERITAECYGPNTAARLLDPDGWIIDIVNNYSKISFNFGPTLLCWLEKHKPDVYQAILEADKLSMKRFSGHGSAIAQAYNHMIMPLANLRDKYTQAIWGIRDFEKRFGRFPEGMWLPETAVDTETLEVLAELGIKFTILAPRQAKRIRGIGKSGKWQDVSGDRIDPTRPYRCVLPSGRAINLFFYDGPISQDIAFNGLLSNGESFAQRLLSAFVDYRSWPQIVHIATDGETYGHHCRFTEKALAYCFYYIESKNLARITNYGEYLEKHPPTHLVEIFDNSSWSCIHGVERWRDNCGCNSGMNPGWTQAWRRPLREAMDRLRDRLSLYYAKEARKYFKDPWEARDDYIEVILDRSRENVERFLAKHSRKELSREEKIKVLKLLGMQRNAMLMYTSCGWFFDEVSGIETVQVMQYAAKAMQYVEDLQGVSIEPQYLKDMEKAPSNVFENGAKTYEMFVRPAEIDLLRVGAHYGISSIFEEYPEHAKLFCYDAISQVYEKTEAGRLKLAIGKTNIVSDVSWDERTISFAVVYFGDHNINGGFRDFIGDEAFTVMRQEIRAAFDKGDIPEVIRLMDRHFGMNNYNVWHLFRDEQRKILTQIMQLTYDGIEGSYRQIYDNNYAVMNFLQTLSIPLPRPLWIAAEYTINVDLRKTLEQEDIDTEKLEALINEVGKWSLEVDRPTIEFVASACIDSHMERLHNDPEDIQLFEKLDNILRLLMVLPLELNLWRAQNVYFSIGKRRYAVMKDRVVTEDGPAKAWLDSFRKLGYYLHAKFQR